MENDMVHLNSENKLLVAIIDKSFQLFKDVFVSVGIRHIFIPAIHNCAKISLRLFQQTNWHNWIWSNPQFYQVGRCRFQVNLFHWINVFLRLHLKRHICRPNNSSAVLLDRFAISKIKSPVFTSKNTFVEKFI